MQSRTSGNVLFLILIAISLFAALSYAVTSSSRSGPGNASKESAHLMAATILQYATLVQVEVDKLRMINNVAYNEIDFYNLYSHLSSSGAIGSPKGKNPNCTAIQSKRQCAVFTDNGGTISAHDFYNYSSNPGFAYTSGNAVQGEAQFFSQYVTDVGSPLPEIVMYIFSLKQDICDAINTRLGLPLADTQTPFPGSSNLGERFYWTDATLSSYPVQGSTTGYNGQSTFCIRSGFTGYSFVHVLIPR
ncbi:MAG: hypothetical protein ABIO86_11555 [Sphingomonas sp.]